MEKTIRIAYLLLCHRTPDTIIQQISNLLSYDKDGCLFIHIDRKVPNEEFKNILKKFENNNRCYFIDKNNRIKCNWGTWSIVKATFLLIDAAYINTIFFTHFLLLSESCTPVKSNIELKKLLSNNHDTNFIDIYDESWIMSGIKKDRYLYRHMLNKKKSPRLHRYMYRFQKNMGLKRKVPLGMNVKFGSQWWCLTYKAIYRMMNDKHIKIKKKFFKFVWIPDESFFSTLIASYKELYTKNTITYSEFDRKTGKCKSVNEITVPKEYFFARKKY